jgi:hypothetical protein
LVIFIFSAAQKTPEHQTAPGGYDFLLEKHLPNLKNWASKTLKKSSMILKTCSSINI